MLYCPECGAVLSDGAKFCYRCKARIAAPIGNGVTPVVKRPEEESISPAAVPVPEEETAHIIDTILEEVPEVIAEPDDETGICADEAAVAEDIVIPEESFAAEALAEDEVLQVTEDLVSAEEPFAEGGDAEADTEPEREDIISSEEPYAEDEDAEADTAPEVEDIASPEEPYTEEEQAETDAEPEEEDIDPSEEAFAEEHTETDAEADAEAEAVSEETCPEEDTDTEPESEDTASETVVSETVPAPEENTERELLNMLEELRPSAHREEQAEPYDLFAALRDIPSFFETESIPVLTGDEIFRQTGSDVSENISADTDTAEGTAAEPAEEEAEAPFADNTVGEEAQTDDSAETAEPAEVVFGAAEEPAEPASAEDEEAREEEKILPDFFFDLEKPVKDFFTEEKDEPAEEIPAEEPVIPDFFFDFEKIKADTDTEEAAAAEETPAEETGLPEFFFDLDGAATETEAEEETAEDEVSAAETAMPEFFFGGETDDTEDAAAEDIFSDINEIPEFFPEEQPAAGTAAEEEVTETEDDAEETVPAAEDTVAKFIFDDDEYDDEVFAEEETGTKGFSEAVKAVFGRDGGGRESEEDEDDSRGAVVRALYTRELVVDKPIRSEEVISEKSDSKETRKRKIISLIVCAALALVLSLAALHYHNRPDNVFARHMKKAEEALSQGDISAAAVEYNKALEIRPDSLQAADMLDSLWEETFSEAEGMAQEGRFVDAVRTAQMLKQIHPDNKEGYSANMEEIYSSWMRAATASGSSDEIERILETAKVDLDTEALSRLEAISQKSQVWTKYEEFFSENSGKILDSFSAGDRAAVFSTLSGMKEKIAAYKAEGGTFPVISETEKAGSHAAFYYGDDGMLQVYIGKLTEEKTRTGTADSFVITNEGGRTEYECYTCEWDKDAPGGSFSDTRYGESIGERYYTYSGKLKDGVYDGDIDAADWEDTVYKIKFENGKVVVQMAVSPGGATNVVGWDEYNVWMLCFTDEDVQRTFALPYVK